jgi:predicted transposase YbfD/YdcC
LWALSSLDLNAYVGSAGTVGEPWPGVSQVCRIQRVVSRKDRKTNTWQTTAEVAYAITSLDRGRADADNVLKRWQVHWHIENRLHWVRDVTFTEDASQIHKGQAPEVFALLRNAAITLIRQFGFSSVATGKRELQMGPEGVLSHFRELASILEANQERIREQLSAKSTLPLASYLALPRAESARSRDRPLVK